MFGVAHLRVGVAYLWVGVAQVRVGVTLCFCAFGDPLLEMGDCSKHISSLSNSNDTSPLTSTNNVLYI